MFQRTKARSRDKIQQTDAIAILKLLKMCVHSFVGIRMRLVKACFIKTTIEFARKRKIYETNYYIIWHLSSMEDLKTNNIN